MECGEQREGLGRHKRAIGLLFLEWLAANLNPHPCRRLRIAQKPRPPASHPLLRPGTAQRLRWPWAAAREGKGALSVLRGRVSVSPEAAVPWHERPFPCSARSCPRSRIDPAARAVGAGGWWTVDVDGLFVCNSHIGVHGKEAMTQTGRRDAMAMGCEMRLPCTCTCTAGTVRGGAPAQLQCAAGRGFLLHTPVTVTHHRVQTHQRAYVAVPTPVPAASNQQPAPNSQRPLHSMAALLGTPRAPEQTKPCNGILRMLMPYHSVLLPQTGAFVCGCVCSKC